MTPQQQSNLEGLVGRALSQAEVDQVEPLLEPLDAVSISAVLSVDRTKVEAPHLVSARGFSSAYPGGPLAAEALLMKLEGAAAAMKGSPDPQTRVVGSLLTRQIGFFNTDAGLDFGDPTLRGMLDQFAALGVITVSEAQSMKSIAVRPAPIRAAEVALALAPPSAGPFVSVVQGQVCVGDSRYRCAVTGDFNDEATVTCYLSTDPEQVPIVGFPAWYVSRGQQ